MSDSKYPNFDKLWHISNAMHRNLRVEDPEKKEPTWWHYMITAITSKDLPGLDQETIRYPKGTKVRIWMVSRFGDVGITDNLTDTATGYDMRVDPDEDLENLEITLKGDK